MFYPSFVYIKYVGARERMIEETKKLSTFRESHDDKCYVNKPHTTFLLIRDLIQDLFWWLWNAFWYRIIQIIITTVANFKSILGILPQSPLQIYSFSSQFRKFYIVRVSNAEVEVPLNSFISFCTSSFFIPHCDHYF